MEDGENNITFSADNPLVDPSQDAFGRYPFAQRIAKTIIDRDDNSNLVLAIYGEWGDGKTSFMNFIKSELDVNGDLLLVNFNPWRFISEEELIREFYLRLAEELDKSITTPTERVGKWIEEYLPTAGAVFGCPDLPRELGKLLSRENLEKLRDRIEKILIENKKQVIVFMDDIDRLEKVEIHSIFRLIKLSLNLRNLIYILAFDDNIVSDALQERYGTENKEAGRRFLEKIVQVPIWLPKISDQDLRSYCFAEIDKILNKVEVNLSEEEVHQFVRGFSVGIEPKLTNARMAIRYANVLFLSIPILYNEVNVVDLLLIEAIKVFYPELYEKIRVNSDKFLGSEIRSIDSPQIVKDQYKRFFDQILDDIDINERHSVKELLLLLFPRMEIVNGSVNYYSGYDEIWTKEKRICSPKYFNRYFLYSIPSDDISDQKIMELLSSINDLTVEENIREFSEIINSRNANNMIYKLYNNLEGIDQLSGQKLAIILSSIGEKFPKPSQMLSFETTFSRAAMLIARLIERSYPEEKREELVGIIINSSEPLIFAKRIISWLNTDPSRGRSSISKNEKMAFYKVLAERISNDLSDHFDKFSESPDDVVSLLGVWSRYKSREEVNKYVTDLIENSSLNISKFLSSFVGYSYPMDGKSMPYKGDFEREEYNRLSGIVDPEIIYSGILINFDFETLEIDLDKYPDSYTHDDDIMIKQFVWFYKSDKRKIQDGEQSKENNEENNE